MELSEYEVKEILEQNLRQIEQIEKMTLNYFTIHNIRYWYSLLSNFPLEQFSIDELLQIEALTSSISIAYGRLFGQGKAGTTKLEDNILPKIYLSAHNEIINLRHRRYAHHGEDSTINKSAKPQYIEGKFKIKLSIEIGFYFGAAKHWGPLFEWLDGYMYDTLYKNINSLSQKTGYVWEMEDGPVPRWIEPKP